MVFQVVKQKKILWVPFMKFRTPNKQYGFHLNVSYFQLHDVHANFKEN